MSTPVKLRLDLNSGIVELEAPLESVDALLDRIERFVPTFAAVRSNASIHARRDPPPKHQIGGAEQEAAAEANGAARRAADPAPPAAKKQAKGTRKESPELRVLPDLNLRPSDKSTLRDFYQSKAPGSNERGFAVMVYYFKKILEVEAITLNHIYTALKDLGMKVPTRLATVLSNSARRHGWIDTTAMDSIGITIHGENFVEHDLPQKPAKKQSRS